MKTKTSKDFKLCKSDKRVLARMIDSEQANHWKHMMINAQVAFNNAKLAKFKERSNTNQGEAQ